MKNLKGEKMRPLGRSDKLRKRNGARIRAGMAAEIDRIKATPPNAPYRRVSQGEI